VERGGSWEGIAGPHNAADGRQGRQRVVAGQGPIPTECGSERLILIPSRRLLGYEPTHSIEQGLDEALDWYERSLQ